MAPSSAFKRRQMSTSTETAFFDQKIIETYLN